MWHPTIVADKLWYVSKWRHFGAPQFDWPQTPGLDPPLQEIDLELSKYLELRGDKFRDLKNESTALKFEKQNCNLFYPSKVVRSVQNKFKKFCP